MLLLHSPRMLDAAAVLYRDKVKLQQFEKKRNEAGCNGVIRGLAPIQ